MTVAGIFRSPKESTDPTNLHCVLTFMLSSEAYRGFDQVNMGLPDANIWRYHDCENATLSLRLANPSDAG